MVARILGIERAFAIGQAADEGPGTFLTKNIAVGQTKTLERLLDRACDSTRSRPEEPVTRFDDFLGSVCVLCPGLIWQGDERNKQRRKKRNEARRIAEPDLRQGLCGHVKFLLALRSSV